MDFKSVKLISTNRLLMQAVSFIWQEVQQTVNKTKNRRSYTLRLCQLIRGILLKGRTKESAVIRCAVRACLRAYSIIALAVIRVKPFL